MLSLTPQELSDESATVVISSIFTVLSIWFIAIVLWFTLGLIAFIMSIVCFFKNNRVGLNIVGLILAILFGPFYFLYFLLAKPYCNSEY